MTGYTNSIEIGGASYSAINSYIAVSYPSGLTCRCTGQITGTQQYYTLISNNTSGYILFPIPFSGSWVVACYNGNTLVLQETVTVASNNIYEVRFLRRVGVDYQEVEYIQNTGYNFIDTGFTMGPDIQMTVDFEFIQGHSSYGVHFLDTRASSGDNRSGFYLTTGTSPKVVVQHGTAVRTANASGNISLNTRYTLWASIKDGGVFAKLNGNDITINTPTCQDNIISTDFQNAAIFARMRTDGAFVTSPDKAAPYAKLYSMQVVRYGRQVADFVPCYNKTTNEAGLWNRVTQTFHGNAYTDSIAQNFTVGPDVT